MIPKLSQRPGWVLAQVYMLMPDIKISIRCRTPQGCTLVIEFPAIAITTKRTG
jgi:hypothetical protein